MYRISPNQVITITRGDTFEAPLFINARTRANILRYNLKKGDAVYFGVMEANVPFEHALIRKAYVVGDPELAPEITPYGEIVVKLDSMDTINLMPGNYYYEVKMQLKDEGKVATIVPRRRFIIEE